MNTIRTLARFVAESRPNGIAEPVRDEAVRALVDWLGCCLGGCLDPALDAATCAPDFGADQATLPGRGRRSDLASVALLSAIAADALDFASIHTPTGVQIGVPIASALVPLAESRAAAGAEVVHAYAVGAELTCRLARTLAEPGGRLAQRTSDACGTIGAAAACARLLGLDASRIAHAIAIAAAQATNLDAAQSPGECLGIAGATRAGLVAALLAHRAPVGSVATVEGAGLGSAFGRADDLAALLVGLGEEWQLSHSAYKAFPCDHALHAAIEACLAARVRHRSLTRYIVGVELRVHPAVLARSITQSPENAAQARRSLAHAAAVALVDGAAGREQFSQWRVTRARIAEMRRRVELRADDSLAVEAARVVLRLTDGRALEQAVRCSRGHPARPLTDAELSDKFRDLASEVLATDQAERVLALAWNIRALGDVGALVRASVPDEALDPAQLPGSPLIPR